MSGYVCELACLPDGEVAEDVVIEVADGRFTRVEPGGVAPDDAERLHGLVLPGLADAHSHAFHRALRGRTHDASGSFWTWREAMYELAGRFTPDRYRDLARAAFGEAALAGITTIGEFHYLHHTPDGTPYADANEMGHALVEAAREAGVRITLLDACYLAGGFGEPVSGVQQRFSDGDAAGWAARVDGLCDRYDGEDDVVVGAAIHSVRAVPADQIPAVAEWARAHHAPLHVHLSEQPSENEACLAAHAVSPTRLLHDAGALGPYTTAVHAIHLEPGDVAWLGVSRTIVCRCPTTERDLADGVGVPVRALMDAGSPLALGADSRAVVDPFEEARGAEMACRDATLQRGHLRADELLAALTTGGHASLGIADAGRIEVGARADLVAVRLDSVRTAGASADTALPVTMFAAAASDVSDVVVDGSRVVRDGQHVLLGDVGRLLADAVAAAGSQP